MMKTLFLIGCLISIAALAETGSHPNFTGEWVMVKEKSDFGGAPAPDSARRVIDHRDPVLKVKTIQATSQGEAVTDTTYNTSGEETKNDIRGTEARSVTHWEGAALIIETKITAQGTQIQIHDRWELSKDGKFLTSTSRVQSPHGEFSLKLVCEKQ